MMSIKATWGSEENERLKEENRRSQEVIAYYRLKEKHARLVKAAEQVISKSRSDQLDMIWRCPYCLGSIDHNGVGHFEDCPVVELQITLTEDDQ